MPYNSTQDLPSNVRKPLPLAAQKLYLRAFNAVLREGGSEEQARIAAWHNVKTKYRNIGGKWTRKMLSTPAYIQGAPLVAENLDGPRKKKPKRKK